MKLSIALAAVVSLLATGTSAAFVPVTGTCTPSVGGGHGTCHVRELHHNPTVWKDKNVPCAPDHPCRAGTHSCTWPGGYAKCT